MGPWLGLLNAYATIILHVFILKKIMQLKGLDSVLVCAYFVPLYKDVYAIK